MSSSLASWLALAALAVAAGVVGLVALLGPQIIARLRRLGPARRARVLTWLCLAPL